MTKWAYAHTVAVPPYCSAFVQVKGTQFVPVFAPGTQVFTCHGTKNSPKTVTPPAGTPGT